MPQLQHDDLFAYAISPMDFGWNLLPTISEHINSMLSTTFSELENDLEIINDVEKLIQFIKKAFILAQKLNWEGDFQDSKGPRIITLPDELSPCFAIAWKQHNNGETFVVSQRSLPWLENNY
jgi:hypothetical protein